MSEPMPHPMLDSNLMPQPYRVEQRTEEFTGCVTLQVAPLQDERLPVNQQLPFAPGQFYMVYLFGHGEVPISVSSDPARPEQLSFTIMGVGATTRALCQLPVGASIGLRGPFGHGWPMSQLQGQDVLLMAGGLGLAPLRPVLYQLLGDPARYGAVTLLYGSRHPTTLLYSSQLAQWHRSAKLNVDVTVDVADRSWRGKVGVVSAGLSDLTLQPANTRVLICGPEMMMRFSIYALLDRGVAADAIYLSMERNMHCATRQCGHCQYGPWFVCADGPVFRFDQVAPWFNLREI